MLFMQVPVEGFDKLSRHERVLAYYLYKAALSGWDVYFQQLHAHGLTIRRLLEEILTHPQKIEPELLDKIHRYAHRVWFARGIYDTKTQKKFLPEFGPAELNGAVTSAIRSGAFKAPEARAALNEYDSGALARTLFDPDFQPILKETGAGKDKVRSSAVNLYENITEKEVESYRRPQTFASRAKAWLVWIATRGWRIRERPYERYPENSRLVKENGKIVEQVYRAGDPERGVLPGLFAQEYIPMVYWLEKAVQHLERADEQSVQARALRYLIRYFKTGDPEEFRRYNSAWVNDGAKVDAVLGPIEAYDDPFAQKGSFQGSVNFKDPAMDQLVSQMERLDAYFEEAAPWDAKYKKAASNPPAIRFVQDLFRSGFVGGMMHLLGQNLPNDEKVRAKHGSKNTIIQNIPRILVAAGGEPVIKEFSWDARRDLELAEKWGEESEALMTAFHEAEGHKLGQVNPALKGSAADNLKQYYHGLEEARAELAALWFVADPHLVEEGLISDPAVAEWSYRNFVTWHGLVDLRLVPDGEKANRASGAHAVARNLIVNYLIGFSPEQIAELEKSGVRGLTPVKGAVEIRERDGKTYLEVADLQQARAAVGQLMAEIMRIKGEGDLTAAQALLENHGIWVRKDWRDQVAARYAALGLPKYVVEIQPELRPILRDDGDIDVELHYPGSFTDQMLRFGQSAPGR